MELVNTLTSSPMRYVTSKSTHFENVYIRCNGRLVMNHGFNLSSITVRGEETHENYH